MMSEGGLGEQLVLSHTAYVSYLTLQVRLALPGCDLERVRTSKP